MSIELRFIFEIATRGREVSVRDAAEHHRHTLHVAVDFDLGGVRCGVWGVGCEV